MKNPTPRSLSSMLARLLPNHFIRIPVFPKSAKTAPAWRSDTNSAIASRSFNFRKRKLQHSDSYRSMGGA